MRELRPGRVLSDAALAELAGWPGLIATGTGAPALRDVLAGLDLDALAAELAPAVADGRRSGRRDWCGGRGWWPTCAPAASARNGRS